MSKLLVVIGATGQQGGSLVDHVLSHPKLSREFKIRGLTRDLSSSSAVGLQKKGVEVVAADVDSQQSLEKAFAGAHTVFGVTITVYDEKLRERELSQGRAIADAALNAGAEWLIWSTLPHTNRISGNKYPFNYHFDSKAETEDYIRSLGPKLRSAFVAPGSFMSNYSHFMAPQPSREGDGTFVMANFVSPQCKIPLIDVAADNGKYIGAILEDPEKFEGRALACATKQYTMEEVAKVMSEKSGKTVKYQQLPLEVYKGFLPPSSAGCFIDMFSYIEAYSYFGPGEKGMLEETNKDVPGLTTLEKWLERPGSCPAVMGN